ncbi:hypothetical protein BC1_00016 [Bacillus phage BC-1]|nr:hypothetical protein BC1_00016 [Bacillus phage BC-1]
MYTYYADTEKEYGEQVPQYKSLKSKTTQYIENENEEIEKSAYEYDECGNILIIDLGDTGKQVYEYEPENKDGFIRYLIKKRRV